MSVSPIPGPLIQTEMKNTNKPETIFQIHLTILFSFHYSYNKNAHQIVYDLVRSFSHIYIYINFPSLNRKVYKLSVRFYSFISSPLTSSINGKNIPNPNKSIDETMILIPIDN